MTNANDDFDSADVNWEDTARTMQREIQRLRNIVADVRAVSNPQWADGLRAEGYSELDARRAQARMVRLALPTHERTTTHD